MAAQEMWYHTTSYNLDGYCVLHSFLSLPSIFSTDLKLKPGGKGNILISLDTKDMGT